jgi:hypothetical protein
MRKLLPALVLAIGASTSILTAQAQPITTADPGIQAVGTCCGNPVNIRRAPTTDQPRIDTCPSGNSITIVCWTPGELVNGTNTRYRNAIGSDPRRAGPGPVDDGPLDVVVDGDLEPALPHAVR